MRQNGPCRSRAKYLPALALVLVLALSACAAGTDDGRTAQTAVSEENKDPAEGTAALTEGAAASGSEGTTGSSVSGAETEGGAVPEAGGDAGGVTGPGREEISGDGNEGNSAGRRDQGELAGDTNNGGEGRDPDEGTLEQEVFETAPSQEVGYEGMEPVQAEQLSPGTYGISVDSSSSMFRITECELEVSEEDMYAHMVLSGSSYGYIYAGTGAEAESSDEASWIADEAGEGGKNTFTFPVSALDMPVECAAFSKNRQHWYDRTLVFRADSLPEEAFAGSLFITAEDLGIADGEYTCKVQLSGGSGRASVESPCGLSVDNGIVTARIVMSSPNYDYMIVDGEKYLPVNTEGNSAFEIEVPGFDRSFIVLADTTAMSVPYEIEYRLILDSSSIEQP